ncbi:MAG: 4Fe-4S binding protein [Thermoanaerobacteraceae bacterium]|nr:4Fe-4S binding protein [Thermoanaerobacteraceae bacterium]
MSEFIESNGQSADIDTTNYVKLSKPIINAEICVGCGKCLRMCSFEAIKIENGIAYIDADECQNCKACIPVCHLHAISYKST